MICTYIEPPPSPPLPSTQEVGYWKGSVNDRLGAYMI